jgi:N-acetylglutamate synthase-like GNAT family acetyltransferase
MMMDIMIRAARAEEVVALTALCLRSKAHWGYDAEFLKASEPSLTVSQERIAEGRVLVAENKDRRLLGVAAADPLKDNAFDLALLFVEPDAIRKGVGETLFAAIVALIARDGAKRLLIAADPNAENFYKRIGARRIGDAPSEAIPDRMLPLLEYVISETPNARRV